jgi:hypothetical protein
VAELLILSRALDVPPVLLVCPADREKTAEVLPGESRATWRALQWFTGEGPYPDSDQAYVATMGWVDKTSTPLALYREHERRTVEEIGAWMMAHNLDGAAATADAEDPRHAALLAAADNQRQMAEGHHRAAQTIREQLEAGGWLPPVAVLRRAVDGEWK